MMGIARSLARSPVCLQGAIAGGGLQRVGVGELDAQVRQKYSTDTVLFVNTGSTQFPCKNDGDYCMSFDISQAWVHTGDK